MKRLKVAVIGFGVMGKHHANVYAALPYTDLVAIVGSHFVITHKILIF